MKRTLSLCIIGLNLTLVACAQTDISTLDFRCSLLDENGSLWLGTEGEGLWRIQGSKPELYKVPGKSPRMSVYEITTDPQGHLWLGTDNGIMEYTFESWNDLPMSTPYVAESKSSIEKAPTKRRVVGISVNHQKHALMAVYDSLSGQRLLMRFNGKMYVDLIKPFKVNAIMEDLDANIWMNNGGFRMDGGKLVSVIKLPTGVVTCAIQDSRGDVWIGTDVAGVYRYDGKEMRHYGVDHGFDGIRVTCVHEDKKGKIWMGTEAMSNKVQSVSYFESGAIHHLQAAEMCPVKSVNTIASDKKGNVWFAGENGALYTYNGRNFTSINTQKLLADN